MNPEDEKFVQSLNCWEDNYDVITDNIQKLSGMLSLQISNLQNIQEEKEHQRNVRHMTLEEQSISRMLNSFEQRFNVELSKLTEFNNKLDTLLTGQQVLVTRIAQIEEKLSKEVTINSPISVKSEEGSAEVNKHIYDTLNKVQRRTKVVEPGKEEFIKRTQEIDFDKLVNEEPKRNNETDFQKVYKKNLNTDDYVLVGYIENNVIEFYPYNERTKPFVPNLYHEDWYVIKDTVRSADGNVYPLYDHVTPNMIEQHPTKSKDRSVMGFRAKNGRIVYYDYFIK